ncbi:2OG-Fe(II) oxygenase [Longispora sp. NPDC051575]|uniref:2OG-Fe(II)-dependent halogenase WelO5 family protein n=1 Tax=Longispora sp. NPDC051575 TaxID=3154943 RepID=UPI0034274DFA
MFTDTLLTSIANGTTAAVRIPDLMTAADCARVLDRLDAVPLVPYDEGRVSPVIQKFGPVLNDHRQTDGTLSASYWPIAQEAREVWRKARLRPDPLAVSLLRLADAWASPVEAATIGGRQVFAGTLRTIDQGAVVHYDEAVREYPDGLFDQQILSQLAFNLFLSVPESGGETSIWRHRWDPEDEQHRESYGYTPEVVDGVQRVQLTPQAGDAILFDPRNYHAVAPSSGTRRIAVAFFLGITSAGDLIAWS